MFGLAWLMRLLPARIAPAHMGKHTSGASCRGTRTLTTTLLQRGNPTKLPQGDDDQCSHGPHFGACHSSHRLQACALCQVSTQLRWVLLVWHSLTLQAQHVLVLHTWPNLM